MKTFSIGLLWGATIVAGYAGMIYTALYVLEAIAEGRI